MACRFTSKCRQFLNNYTKCGRGDIHMKYILEYCYTEKRKHCKRKIHFLEHGRLPSDEITPSGHMSYLQKIYTKA